MARAATGRLLTRLGDAVRGSGIGDTAEEVVRTVVEAVPDGSGPDRSEFRPSGPGSVALALATHIDVRVVHDGWAVMLGTAIGSGPDPHEELGSW